MYTYVNKVNCAVNSDQKEVMLSFQQINPIFKEGSDDGTPTVSATPVSEDVVNLIMTEEFAKKLKALLNEMV